MKTTALPPALAAQRASCEVSDLVVTHKNHNRPFWVISRFLHAHVANEADHVISTALFSCCQTLYIYQASFWAFFSLLLLL